MTDLDQLDIMRRAITALGLGQCAPEELVAEARASSSRREQDRGTLADQRTRIKDLESALRERDRAIDDTRAAAAARDMRIADLERDLAAKADTIKTTNAAADFAESRAKAAEATLAEIGLALDDAGAPKVYDLPDDTERSIPDPERIRLLGERVRGEHAERIREGDRAQIYRDRLAAADLALDDRDAPRHADGSPLSIAARIRALPR